jgi:hypothetical protein
LRTHGKLLPTDGRGFEPAELDRNILKLDDDDGTYSVELSIGARYRLNIGTAEDPNLIEVVVHGYDETAGEVVVFPR